MENKTYFSPGDKVEYTYTHHLNHRSSTQITKVGVFIRHPKKKPFPPTITTIGIVRFKGNKGNTRVALTKLKNLEIEQP
jgi:hypothetical protein